MVKGLGLLLLILATTAYGIYKSMCLARRVRLLDGMARLCAYVSSQIRYSGAPVSEILSKAASCEEFRSLPCLDKIPGSDCWRDAWLDGLAGGVSDWGATDKDIELIREFSQVLGTTDVEGQVEHCSMYRDMFTHQRDDAKELSARKGKLYIILGLSVGSAVALLLF